jgi:hypothetical protein
MEDNSIIIQNKCILCQEQSYCIWQLSFLSLISSLYAIYKGYYDLALVPGGIFLTSINYWRNPDYSWRRILDMTYIKFAVIYQIIRAYQSQYSTLYYMILFISICWYPIGIYFYKKKSFWLSTYSHCILHIIANISNYILYSGYIVPISENPIFSYFIPINSILANKL